MKSVPLLQSDNPTFWKMYLADVTTTYLRQIKCREPFHTWNIWEWRQRWGPGNVTFYESGPGNYHHFDQGRRPENHCRVWGLEFPAFVDQRSYPLMREFCSMADWGVFWVESCNVQGVFCTIPCVATRYQPTQFRPHHPCSNLSACNRKLVWPFD